MAAAVSAWSARPLCREERAAWVLMGAGHARLDRRRDLLLRWSSRTRTRFRSPPWPTSGYLAFYPASYVALVLLVRARMPGFRRSLWLDGAIAALAVAALAAALAFEPIIDAQHYGDALAAWPRTWPTRSATSCCSGIVVGGVRPVRAGGPAPAWKLIGAGLAAMAVADGVYLLQAAEGTYVEGGLLDALWPAGALLVGFAAWVRSPVARRALRAGGPAHGDRARRLRRCSRSGWPAPPTSPGSATATMALQPGHPLPRDRADGLGLPATTSGCSPTAACEALTDALTGLGNRRSVMLDLEEAMLDATRGASPGWWCSSTSTASRATTTPTATRPATSC